MGGALFIARDSLFGGSLFQRRLAALISRDISPQLPGGGLRREVGDSGADIPVCHVMTSLSYAHGLSLICLLVFIATAGSLSAQEVNILHSPVISVTAGQAIEIDAAIEGSTEPVIEGRIYYRVSGQEAYVYTEMLVTQFNLTGSIPAVAVTSDYIEYYIEVYLPDNLKLIYPPNAPSVDPLHVTIRPIGAGEADGEPAVIVLSPAPGSSITGDQTLIALSLMQHIRQMNPDNLRIMVDGYDLTGRAQVSEDMITLVAEGMKSGEHYIALYMLEDDQKHKLTGWSFMIRSVEEARITASRIRGNLAAKYDHEEIGGKTRNITAIDGRFNGRISEFDWAGKLYFTSLERGYLQPQNRFLGSVRYGPVILRAGDIQPQLSEFTLWGARTRGAQFALRTRSVNLDLVWGFLRRDIEGSYTTIDDIITNPDKGTVDTLEVDVITPGTYSRRVLALRSGFPLWKNAYWNINLLKVKDDAGSIDYGLGPADNLVLGTDLKMVFDNRRIIFTSEVALSLYNSDISGGPMDEAKKLESIIVVNQFFEPMPSNDAILQDDISAFDLTKEIFQELLESATAHRTSLTLNYYKNELRLGYKNVGRSFNSLGSQTVLTDLKGFSIQDRVRLFGNRIYLNAGYENYRDNINDRNETTTKRHILRGGIAYYSPPSYPNVNFGYRMHSRKNDGTIYTYTLPDDSLVAIDDRIENGNASYNFGLSQTFNFAGFSNNAVLMFSNSKTTDQINTEGYNDAKMTSVSISLRTRKGARLEGSTAWRMLQQVSVKGDMVIDYNTLNLNTRYMLTPDQLWVSGGINMTIADGSNTEVNPKPTDPADASEEERELKIDYNRLRFNLGVEYHLSDVHQFRLNTYKVLYEDNGYSRYWDDEYVYNKDKDGFIKHDDLVARLGYIYNF